MECLRCREKRRHQPGYYLGGLKRESKDYFSIQVWEGKRFFKENEYCRETPHTHTQTTSRGLRKRGHQTKTTAAFYHRCSLPVQLPFVFLKGQPRHFFTLLFRLYDNRQTHAHTHAHTRTQAARAELGAHHTIHTRYLASHQKQKSICYFQEHNLGVTTEDTQFSTLSHHFLYAPAICTRGILLMDGKGRANCMARFYFLGKFDLFLVLFCFLLERSIGECNAMQWNGNGTEREMTCTE